MKRNSMKKYRDLRVKLYLRGVTLRQFALANQIPMRSVYGAARGERAGVKSLLILKKIEDFVSAA